MNRFLTGLFVLSLLAAPAWAHFIFIVPEGPNDAKAKVVFSEGLEPDDNVPIQKIATTKLHAGEKEVSMTKGDHAYLIDIPADAKSIGGECRYGLLQRGESKAFLLNYYPKLIRGDVTAAPALGLPLEIMAKGNGRFALLFDKKPAAGAEVHVVAPETKGPIKTDDKGEFTIDAAKPGLYGLRARHIEAKAGDVDGKKYEESRHYATLVFRVEQAKEQPSALPALPKAVASFGADIADGWLYVYGGHCAKTHVYSTESVIGTFHRLKIAEPSRWEELPGGPAVQGLALVAHGGKLYRIGGMAPRNKPGEKADNHSVSSFAEFDPATGKWESLPDLPDARSSHDAVVVGDKIVVVGGWKLNGAGKESDWHTTSLVMDLGRQPLAWQSVKQPFKRRALAAAVVDSKVFVIGGMADDNTTERTVDVFDPANGTWSNGPKLPGPDRNGFAPAAYGARGRIFTTIADGRVMRLATDGSKWEEAGRLTQPRIAARMLAGDQRWFVLGGAMKGANIDSSEVIVP